jgi:hypothetical protein
MSKLYPVTINLSEKESDVLSLIADQKGMSKTAVMRQALRLYQMVAQAETVEIIVNGERKVVML